MSHMGNNRKGAAILDRTAYALDPTTPNSEVVQRFYNYESLMESWDRDQERIMSESEMDYEFKNILPILWREESDHFAWTIEEPTPNYGIIDKINERLLKEALAELHMYGWC